MPQPENLHQQSKRWCRCKCPTVMCFNVVLLRISACQYFYTRTYSANIQILFAFARVSINASLTAGPMASMVQKSEHGIQNQQTTLFCFCYVCHTVAIDPSTYPAHLTMLDTWGRARRCAGCCHVPPIAGWWVEVERAKIMFKPVNPNREITHSYIKSVNQNTVCKETVKAQCFFSCMIPPLMLSRTAHQSLPSSTLWDP